ncbi:MAG: BON domain-containing protein [Acidobacteria bacterium]|nr:BON domain-containing protein [Acidobacteriota bacterium]
MRSNFTRGFVFRVSLAFVALAACAAVSSAQSPTGQRVAENERRTQVRLAEEARHALVTLPYYGVFDWLEGQVMPDGSVTLRGEVVRPTTKSDAEARLRDIDGVTSVNNQIEVLPLSPNDDRLRQRLYRAIYNFNSPLFRYAERAVPPIHIIVSRGRVTLKGVVDSRADSQLAYMRARTVPGSFAVDNQLEVANERIR